MARSPLQVDESLGAEDPYFQNWNRLSNLIAQGKSFSGRERHCVFLNTGSESAFASISGASRLNWPDDGRALAVTDWDGDGDLDFWMTQRNGPRVRVVQNNVSATHRYVTLFLESVKGNRDAVGARVTLKTSRGRELHRSLRAGDGFLSQSTKSLHLGLLGDEEVEALTVRWPGVVEPEAITGIERNQAYVIKEGSGVAAIRASGRTEPVVLEAAPPERRVSEANGRLVFINRLDFPSFRYVDFAGEIVEFDPKKGLERPTLVNLWASWCAPCTAELKMLSERFEGAENQSVDVLALCIEAVAKEGAERDLSAAKALVAEEGYPFSVGVIDEVALQALTRVQHRAVAKQMPLALPTSYLLDRNGKLGALYFGPVSRDQLDADVALLEASSKAIEAVAFPFPGRNGVELFPLSILAFAEAYQAGGYVDDARRMVTERGDAMTLKERFFLGALEQSQLNWPAAAEAYAELLKQSPGQVAIHVPLGVALWEAGQQEEAKIQFETAERLAADQPRLWTDLGRAHLQIGEPEKAIAYFERSGNQAHLAGALVKAGRVDEGVVIYEALLKANPDEISLGHRLAWVLATRSRPSQEEVQRALSLAKRIGEQTQHRDPRALDVLAAAHAQAGEFETAVRDARRARRLARATGDERLVEDLNERVEAYEARQPWRDKK